MDALAMLIIGAALAGMGLFMYSSRAVDLVQQHPFWKWPVGREILQRLVLAWIPEGVGLLLAGVARLVRLEEVGLFAFIAANLIAGALCIGRPYWAEPHWMRRG
jgi:hypothetical protein